MMIGEKTKKGVKRNSETEIPPELSLTRSLRHRAGGAVFV